MAPVTGSIEIARAPGEVWAYIDDIGRHSEWQERLVSVEVETPGPTRVGTRAVSTRRVPGGPRKFVYEMTEHDPPNRASFRVVEGPIRPFGTVTLTPLDGATRTRVNFE